ncbi:MAG TPA: polysaccharide deacetylase family protein, partial [Archaeoglobus sp.]|nr:polysaccharide deacetylase family protein [Archaeoglobus sp.]
MAYFYRNFKILSLNELVQYIRQGKPLPKRVVIITFDDGYRDIYLHAYPILRKYHIPATIFLTTGLIGTGNLFWWDKVAYVIQHTIATQLSLDELGSYSLHSKSARFHASLAITEGLRKLPNERRVSLVEKLLSTTGVDIPEDLGKKLILSWDEVKEMSNGGIEFGAHSVTHPVLTNMPLEEAKWEIVQSKKDIERKIGKEVTAFSYPNGNFSPKIIEIVQESGFDCAVSTLPRKLIS